MLQTIPATLALLLNACSPVTVAQDAESKPPLVIAEQGSFSVGGRTVQGAGVFDPTKSPAGTNDGQTMWVDQMYVQYQIPVDTRIYPLVLVHGGAGQVASGSRRRMAAKATRLYSCAAATRSTLLTSPGVVVLASRRSTARSATSTARRSCRT
jgi:hypothetical protein